MVSLWLSRSTIAAHPGLMLPWKAGEKEIKKTASSTTLVGLYETSNSVRLTASVLRYGKGRAKRQMCLDTVGV